MKTIMGSAVALFLGTSCCWLSAFFIWLGGFTFIGVFYTLVKSLRFIITVAVIVLPVLGLIYYALLRIAKNGTE